METAYIKENKRKFISFIYNNNRDLPIFPPKEFHEEYHQTSI
jgi:hypothetical protein